MCWYRALCQQKVSFSIFTTCYYRANEPEETSEEKVVPRNTQQNDKYDGSSSHSHGIEESAELVSRTFVFTFVSYLCKDANNREQAHVILCCGVEQS
jgi:hypothetical protein